VLVGLGRTTTAGTCGKGRISRPRKSRATSIAWQGSGLSLLVKVVVAVGMAWSDVVVLRFRGVVLACKCGLGEPVLNHVIAGSLTRSPAQVAQIQGCDVLVMAAMFISVRMAGSMCEFLACVLVPLTMLVKLLPGSKPRRGVGIHLMGPCRLKPEDILTARTCHLPQVASNGYCAVMRAG